MKQPKIFNFMDEEFTGTELYYTDLLDILEKAYEEYNNMPKNNKNKKIYKLKYNRLVDILAEKVGFKQLSYLK
jgi:hypothetical protein